MHVSSSFAEIFSNSLVDSLDEIQSVQVTALWNVVCTVDANGQILCHFSALDSFDS